MTDIFISFVSRDRSIAEELADNLEKRGISADFTNLHLGDNLGSRVEQGLRQAEYGVLILSKTFFKKPWPRNDLDKIANIDRTFDGPTRLLPVWHEIEQQDIARYSSALASRIGASTKEGLNFVADEIVDAVKVSTSATESKPFQKQDIVQQILPIENTYAKGNLPLNDPMALRDALVQHFDISELQDLAWEMNVDYENIPGSTINAKARELITYSKRHGLLDQLVRQVQIRRPFLV